MKTRILLVLATLFFVGFSGVLAETKKVTDLAKVVCTLTDSKTCGKLQSLPHPDVVKLNNVAAACFKKLNVEACYNNSKYLFNNGDSDLRVFWERICRENFEPACVYEKDLATKLQ